jgi:16S rRNA (uracil1498-N3)-methyltransferase
LHRSYNGPVARRRFFVERIQNGFAELSGEDARHLARVLRAEAGQQYEISDNERVYLAEISDAKPGRVIFRVLEPVSIEEIEAEALPTITLFAALIKFDRFEWMVEKATELGVARIVPFEAERCEKGLSLAARKRVERWRKIAHESSQQSRRVHLPEIEPPRAFSEVLLDASSHRYFLDEQPGGRPLLEAFPPVSGRVRGSTIAFLTGPEGGWTNPEREQAQAAGWTPASAGPTILRAETAATAALAIAVNAWWAAIH